MLLHGGYDGVVCWGFALVTLGIVAVAVVLTELLDLAPKKRRGRNRVTPVPVQGTMRGA